MTRFRIRFQLQEMDVSPGEIVIGRAGSCQMTIDDPLVSRNHARLLITADDAFIEDLNSRNGVRVNGRTIDAQVSLADGDRVRIGTQQIIIRRIDDSEVRNRRATGFMIHCSNCGLPYATDTSECPNCGGGAGNTLVVDEPTTTTVQSAWNLELLVETLQRARRLGRTDDILRLLLRAREELEHNKKGSDLRRVEQLASAAIEFAVDSGDIDWGRWALMLYADFGLVPRKDVGERLSALPTSDRMTLAPAALRVVQSVRPLSGGPEEAEAMEKLLSLANEGSGL